MRKPCNHGMRERLASSASLGMSPPTAKRTGDFPDLSLESVFGWSGAGWTEDVTVEPGGQGEDFAGGKTQTSGLDLLFKKVDTIKIIAYRAETAMAHIVREKLNAYHQDEARALIRDLCMTPADLYPDPQAKTLTITLHSLATPKLNPAVAHLCTELNASEIRYPGTELLMIFKSVSD
ncbi:MAG: putative transposase [Kiritimatiellia bacterium]